MRSAFRSRSTSNLIAPAALLWQGRYTPSPCLAVQSPLTQDEAVVQRGRHGLLFVPRTGRSQLPQGR
jgi:hypothetical protein